ncbi:DNA mismatch repair protein MutL [Moorella humiferrea]|uniref:DNA mismatch repair endonuclease MutL n=1 Tax=Neomoorella humiferrea TaxID=676965 RepID=UPI0030D1E397
MYPEAYPRIKILDVETANQIAAGEVVERPASVVKELVENSIDAAARRITVEVMGGGLTLIRVRDDGIGIRPEDAPLAFARHATSKIRRASDLFQINTLGFRGEALPSIAAVARVEMDTRAAGEKIGVRVRVAGGGEPEVNVVGCPPGTTVTVTDLFYNTPARRQFLKKPTSEARAAVAIAEKLALAHPEVAFAMYLEGKRLFATQGNGELLAVITALYGLEMGRELLPLSDTGEGWALKGYISPPWLHRAGRSHQVLIVNGRYIFNRTITRAVEDCYRTVIPSGRYPIFVLHLAIDPQKIDVNVHPAKLEVKFQQEHELAQKIGVAINKTLHTPRAVMPASTSPRTHQPRPSVMQPQLSFEKEKRSGFWGEYILRESPGREEKKTVKIETKDIKPSIEKSDQGAAQNLPPLKVLGQLGSTYILAEGQDGLYIIDQHAAHERCRYEKLCGQINSGSWPAQMLEPPKTLHLSPDMAIKVREEIGVLEKMGFIIEAFGNATFLLRAVPVGMPIDKAKEVLEDFLSEGDLPAEERLLKIIACRGAVKGGDVLSVMEMQELLDALRGSQCPYTCPHGRPALIRLEWSAIARYFQR